jgi:hypothetical protein
MDEAGRLEARMRTAFVLAVLALAIFVVWTAGDFRRAARLFPQYAGGITVALCVLELARQLLRRKLIAPGASGVNTADIGLDPEERSRRGLLRSLGIFGWILGYGLLIVSIGMTLATALFVPALLRLRFDAPWLPALGLVAGLWALMAVLRTVLDVRLPAGWLTGTFPF